MDKNIKKYDNNKTYLFGDIVFWEGKMRILAVGSSHGVAPGPQYLFWKKYGE